MKMTVQELNHLRCIAAKASAMRFEKQCRASFGMRGMNLPEIKKHAKGPMFFKTSPRKGLNDD